MKENLLRSLSSKGPLRIARDGMLKLLYKLDPDLSALKDEIDWKVEQAINELPLWSWHRLDKVYAEARASLLGQTLQGKPNWRKGPVYSLMIACHAGERIAGVTELDGKTYFDLGCGAHNPFATSALMYLNGADRIVGFDQAEALNKPRVAVALFEILSYCALFPDKACWKPDMKDRFYERLSRFDAEALSTGNLDIGLKDVPMRYAWGDIHGDLPVDEGSIDVMSSRDVLEHFLELPKAMERVAAMMSKNSVACHHIDVADHRIYKDLDPEDFTPEVRKQRGVPQFGFHPWSFLAEPDDYSDGLCNRARASEFRHLFNEHGFEIVRDEPDREPLPDGFRAKLSPRYAALDDEDLETTRITLTLKRS